MKKPKNSIKIILRGNTISLTLPRVYCGKTKTIALHISNNPENWKFAELKAKQIEMDLLTGTFDVSLSKYFKKLQTSQKKTETAPSLLEVYEYYIKFKRKQVSATTWKHSYRNTVSHLTSCPYKLLSEALKASDWIVQNRTPDTARRILMQINAACEWALERELISSNPFKGKCKIKTKKTKAKIQPFSLVEKNLIIESFDRSDKFQYLSSIIKFFFLTGCRTSEALGLQWKHILSDCSQICFQEVMVLGVGGAQRKQGTKQSPQRVFPCNRQLKDLLLFLKPEKAIANTSVFLRSDGSQITHQDLRTAWYGKGKILGIVRQLAEDGKIEAYRPQYNTRHTMISQCLDAGIPPTQIAEWVGNSAEIIFRNYAGIINKISVPEFD